LALGVVIGAKDWTPWIGSILVVFCGDWKIGSEFPSAFEKWRQYFLIQPEGAFKVIGVR
jgi:hypothetical protein